MTPNPEIINLNKPPGPTSHDMVDLARRLSGERRIGHAGTLDPFAQGVLILLIGRAATRRQKEFMSCDKTYRAAVCLGATSDTDDLTGRVIENPKGFREPDEATIRGVLEKFIGEILQTPPSYSALKIKGKKAYEIARRGGSPELLPRTVHIKNIKLIKYRWPALEIEVDCGSGTYIRALARDIGQALGCGAYLQELTRTRVGEFSLENSVRPEDLEKILTLRRE